MNTRIIIIKSAVVLGTVLCGLASESCRKEARPGDYVPKTGDEVVFSAADGGSAIGTKAAYAGRTSTDNTQEYINWEQGDLYRIFCAECSEPTSEGYGKADHWADYEAQGRNEGNSGVTIATLAGTVGLRWGDVSTVHNFYGIYPSPKMNTGKTTLNGAELTGTIRQNQAVRDIIETEPETGKTLNTARPDMTDMYMAGRTSVNPSTDLTGNDVLIGYTPLTTAIEFTITKDTDLTEDVEWVAIESASHNLYGVFTADLAEEWTTPTGYSKAYPTCTYEDSKPDGETSSEPSRLKIDFTGEGMQISNTKALRFTFLLLPVSGAANVVDDLSFIIKKGSGGTAGILKTELKRTDGATEEENKVPFPTHKKSYIRGLMVPDRVQWTITFEPTVNPWGSNEGGETDAEEAHLLTFATELEKWKDVDGSTITMED